MCTLACNSGVFNDVLFESMVHELKAYIFELDEGVRFSGHPFVHTSDMISLHWLCLLCVTKISIQ